MPRSSTNVGSVLGLQRLRRGLNNDVRHRTVLSGFMPIKPLCPDIALCSLLMAEIIQDV